MCKNKDGKCACGCENNTEHLNDLSGVYDSTIETVEFVEQMDDKKEEKDVIVVDGVEYVRKNKKELLEEPVIVDNEDMVRLDE